MTSPDTHRTYPKVTDRSEEVQAALGMAGVGWAVKPTEEIEPLSARITAVNDDPELDIFTARVPD